MTSISQEQQATSDESFQAELRAWLAANVTDEFREKRTMTFQEKVAGWRQMSPTSSAKNAP